MKINNEEAIKLSLKNAKRLPSSSPMRLSNVVAAFMKKQDYKIIPVNPNESIILDEEVESNLSA